MNIATRTIRTTTNQKLKLNAREKTLGAGEKIEAFETHFRIKWC
jgi:hypothetical protein